MRLTRRARAGSVCFGALLGLMVVPLGPAAPAAAHAYLQGSDPSDGAVLPATPGQVVLTFSEPVQPVPDRVLVVDPDGERIERGPPAAEGAVITIPLGGDGPRGTYLVSFRVTSADGHPAGGVLSYSVGAPSATPPVPGGTGESEAAGTALSVVKYVGYAGLALVVGSTAVLMLLWPRRLSRRSAARLLWTGVGLVAASTLAALWLQASYTTGRPIADVTGAGLRDVLATTYGRAHLVRLGVLAAAAWLLRRVTAGRATRSDVALLSLLGVVGLGTWPVAGHAVTAPLPVVGIAAGTVHLAAAAFWLGGLVVLAGILLRRADQRELSGILPVWSGWAATAVAVLLLAGLVRAALEAGAVAVLLSTGYGRLLLVKVGLLALVFPVAWYSRRLIRRGLGAAGPRVMRTAVAVEAGLLAAVVALSSVLVQTTPARTEGAVGAGAGTLTVDYFTTTLDTDLYSLEVIIDPADRGTNTVHLYAYTDTGRPQPVVEWGARVSLSGGVEALDVSLQRVSDNHALGEVTLPLAGEWVLRVTARTSEIDQATVLVSVPVDAPS
jgi:copper transport protein